jgi:hypothetical protein
MNIYHHRIADLTNQMEAIALQRLYKIQNKAQSLETIILTAGKIRNTGIDSTAIDIIEKTIPTLEKDQPFLAAHLSMICAEIKNALRHHQIIHFN